jgi:tetratricopeptide (TPR) repeat protein
MLARALIEIDDRRALQVAERLIVLAPEGHRGHLIAAIACNEMNRREEAERHARAAIEAAPWLPFAYGQLAQSLAGRRGRREEAMEAARDAIELEPDSIAGYFFAGNVELGYGNWDDAEHWYNRALQVDPNARVAKVNLALAKEAKGQLGKAFIDTRSLLRLDPSDAGARRILDETVYSTLIHLLWISVGLLVLVTWIRGLN